MERIIRLDKNYKTISDSGDLDHYQSNVLKFIDQNHDIVCTMDQTIQKNLNSGIYHRIDRYDSSYKLKGTIWPNQIIVADNVDLTDLKYLIICIGGSVIWRIPLQLIISLFPPLKIDSQYQINIPKSYFFDSSALRWIWDWVTGLSESISDKFIDLTNQYKLHGITLFMYNYHETDFQLVGYESGSKSGSGPYNPIKFDLNFETVYMSPKCLDIFSYLPHGIFYSINLIHGIDIHKSMWLLRPTWYHKCCPNVKMYFSDNSLSDMELFIAHIFKNKPDKQFIDIHDELKKIRAHHIENKTKMINPLCQIIAGYMDDSHKGSYAEILNDQTIRLHLYTKNELRTYSGMGGVGIEHCYQSHKNKYDQNYRDV